MLTRTKVIIFVALIGLMAFENCNGFFRPLPSLLNNTLNRVLKNRLERRFGITISWPTTTTSTTATTTTSPPTTTPTIQERKKCNLKNFKDCTLKEWNKFMKHVKHVLRHRRHMYIQFKNQVFKGVRIQPIQKLQEDNDDCHFGRFFFRIFFSIFTTCTEKKLGFFPGSKKICGSFLVYQKRKKYTKIYPEKDQEKFSDFFLYIFRWMRLIFEFKYLLNQ